MRAAGYTFYVACLSGLLIVALALKSKGSKALGIAGALLIAILVGWVTARLFRICGWVGYSLTKYNYQSHIDFSKLADFLERTLRTETWTEEFERDLKVLDEEMSDDDLEEAALQLAEHRKELILDLSVTGLKTEIQRMNAVQTRAEILEVAKTLRQAAIQFQGWDGKGPSPLSYS